MTWGRHNGLAEKGLFLESDLLLYRAAAGGQNLGTILSFRVRISPLQAVEIEKIRAAYQRARGCLAVGRQDRGVNRKLFGKMDSNWLAEACHGNRPLGI